MIPQRGGTVALAKSLLALLGLVALVVYFVQHFPQMQTGMDFTHFYAAARIVHDGRGAQLYETAVQDEYMARYTGRVGPYFNHPPFEALGYLPFCLSQLRTAYALWTVFNALLLIAVARLLPAPLSLRWGWQVLLLLSLLFVPLLLNFLQGQDALVLLFFLCAAFVAAEADHSFLSGCLLAGGLVKFHVTVPVVILLLWCAPRRMWRGFALTALGLLLASVEISGWRVIATYPRFVFQLNALPLAGIHWEAMANLRGLWVSLFPQKPTLAPWLTAVSSLTLFAIAVHAARLAAKAKMHRLSWAMAVVTAILVSYHLSPHDLTVLLLPVALIVDHVRTAKGLPASTKILIVAIIGLLGLPISHLLLLREHLYTPMGLVVLLLYAVTYVEIGRSSAVTVHPSPESVVR